MNRLPIAAFAAACMLGMPSASHAQLIAGPGLGAKPQAQKPATPPPPALPGAQSDNDRVAPAEKQATDMQPTDALFDSINRGDIASARDSVARGADLNGHNLLGMTPMELSVDLGRNNITFLLLSLRAPDSVSPAKTAGILPSPAKPSSAKRPVQRAERPAPAPVRQVAAPAPRAPKMFAGDGGTPIPAAGFLGFDAGRSGTVR